MNKKILITSVFFLNLLLYGFNYLSANKFKLLTDNGKTFCKYNGVLYPVTFILKDSINSSIENTNSYVAYLNKDSVCVEFVDSSKFETFKDKNILSAWNGKDFLNPNNIQNNDDNNYKKNIFDPTSNLNGNYSLDNKKYSDQESSNFLNEIKNDRERVYEILSKTKTPKITKNELIETKSTKKTIVDSVKDKFNSASDFSKEAFKSDDINTIKCAIALNNEVINLIEGKDEKYIQLSSGAYIKTRDTKRKETSHLTAIDGTVFKNKEPLFSRKHNYKYAARDGLTYNNKLLQKKLDELKLIENSNSEIIFESANKSLSELIIDPKISPDNLTQNSEIPNINKNDYKENYIPPDIQSIDNSNIEKSNIETINDLQFFEILNNPTFGEKVTQVVSNIVNSKFGKEATNNSVSCTISNMINGFKEQSERKKTLNLLKSKQAYEEFEENEKYVKRSVGLNENQLLIQQNIDQKVISIDRQSQEFFDSVLNPIGDMYCTPIVLAKDYFLKSQNLVYKGLDLTDHFNSLSEFETANTFANFSASLLESVKGTAKFLTLIGNGAYKSISRYKDPILLVKNFGAGFLKLGASLGDCALKTLELGYYLTIDQDKFIEESFNIAKKVSKKIDKIYQQFDGLPYEEKVILISELSTSLVLDSVTFGLAGETLSKISSFWKYIPELVKEESYICKYAGSLIDGKIETAKSLLMPVQNSISNYTDIIFLSTKYGFEKTKNALTVIQDTPKVLALENSLIKNVELVILNRHWNLKGLIHVCKGNFRIGTQLGFNGEPILGLESGMHTVKALNHFLKMCKIDKSELIIEKLENGVTRVILDKKHFATKQSYRLANNGAKLNGTKTLWPNNYTPNDILNAGQDILKFGKNGINSKTGAIIKNKFIGITKDGIKAIVWVNENGLITTCYPDWFQ